MDKRQKKLIFTVLWVIAFLYFDFLLFIIALMCNGLLRAIYLLLIPIPFMLLGFVWLPRKKKYMIPLASTVGVFIISTAVCYGIHTYNESLIIDTTPAINLSEYLPFDENSKIVKIRSEDFLIEEDAPTIDGAAALFPVYSAFVNATYPEDTRLYDGIFEYNNTPNGYRLLAEKKTDLFIGVYPSKEQLAYAEENKTTLKFTPIGYDAFVFFVHKDNPIESLTSEQIKAIYSGEITNWKQLGGNDEEIVAYQRNAGSGSQSMLIRFMGDKEPMPAPSVTVNGMGGIIEQVANYKSVSASIGFSFRFYVEGIIKNPDIKMISIDGVAPTAESVRSGAYPIRTPFYAVTYEENENPNTDALINWILSKEGQYIIEESGYIGIGE